MANEHLPDPAFGFKVVSCRSFFEFVLNNHEKFDAVVDNPPWDRWFLSLYYKFLRFLQKPCIIVLIRAASKSEAFLKVFGRSTLRTVISYGTDCETERRKKVSRQRKS